MDRGKLVSSMGKFYEDRSLRKTWTFRTVYWIIVLLITRCNRHIRHDVHLSLVYFRCDKRKSKHTWMIYFHAWIQIVTVSSLSKNSSKLAKEWVKKYASSLRHTIEMHLTQWLKPTQKVSFYNIVSEASYFYYITNLP